MNEKMIWMAAYTSNIQQGVSHDQAMQFADEVVKKVMVLND